MGTLRWALAEIEFAIIDATPWTIPIEPGLTISLEQSPLVLSPGLAFTTIIGNGATLTTSNPNIPEGLIVEAEPIISGLRFLGFSERGLNVGISNVQVRGCTFEDNGEEGLLVHQFVGRAADNCIIGGPNPEDRNIFIGNGHTGFFTRPAIHLTLVNGPASSTTTLAWKPMEPR